jgi:hypothetical protein
MGGFGWFLVGLMIGGSIGAVIMGIIIGGSQYENYHPYRKGSE